MTTTETHCGISDLAEWQDELRAQFPIIVGNEDLVYLDSSATAQKPQSVLDAVSNYLTQSNANAGRGTYTWANNTTDIVERARDRIKAFLGDPEPDRSTVTFVDGASTGLRRVAVDWLVDHLVDGDEIVVPTADHRANSEPWLEAQQLLAARGVHVTVIDMPYESSGSGDYDIAALQAAITPATRFVAATHVHHVYGANMNVHRIRELVGDDVVICLDAAQSVGHTPIDLAALDVDFLVFSGHKALAFPGSGAVWARNARGGPYRARGWAGSPNTAGIVSLCAAMDWLDTADLDRIDRWTTGLGALLTDGLTRLNSYDVLGCQASLALSSTVQRRQGIVTFRHRNLSSNDLGFILASRGLMVRADGHCQGHRGETESSVRASMHIYNTPADIARLLDALAELEGAQ